MFDDQKDDDDEISLDFSKISNFFKGKKKENKETTTHKSKEEEINKLSSENKEDLESSKTSQKETEPQKEENIQEIKKEPEIKEEPKEKDLSDDEEEDEVSLDFSKITNMFKGKKEDDKEDEIKKEAKSEAAEQNPTEESEEEEISFDFSKIKSFFKKKEKSEDQSDQEEDSEEGISLDYKKTFGSLKKHKNILIPLIIILFVMSLSIHLRIHSAYLPVTDNWARDNVHNFMRSQIRGQIDQQYPNLPDNNKNALVESEFQKVLKEQKGQLDQQITATSQHLKSQLQNDNGQTYLIAIDPYFWMRQAKNIIDHGFPGDELKDGIQWDNHMFAPLGRPNPPDVFHPYFEAYVYNIWSFFNKEVGIMKVAFFIPVIIATLSVIPAFFIARRVGGNFGGFIAGTFVAISPAFLNRTVGGFSDTDAYNVLLPLLVAWLFIEAIQTDKLKNSIILASLSGLIVGIFSLAWGGWWYVFDFVLIAYLVYLVHSLITSNKKTTNSNLKRQSRKNILIIGIVLLLSSAIFVSTFTSFDSFKNGFLSPIDFTKIKDVAVDRIWPNVLTTVAEQNEAGIDSLISNIGGKFLFIIALMGIILALTKKDSKNINDLWFILFSAIWYTVIILSFTNPELITFLILLLIPIALKIILSTMKKEVNVNLMVASLITVWILSTLYAGTKGIRWVLLLVPAFSIAMGIALGVLYKYLHNTISNEFKVHKILSKLAVIILLSLLLLGPWNAAKSIAQNSIPSMNDAWYNSLDKINREGAPDAIINSWWDFGHWFKAIGDRAVTFDGTTQDTPQAHWIGRVLLTDDEDTAIGILRMLDCGAHKAFDEVNNDIKDTAKSTEILYQIFVLDKEEAKNVLLSHDLDEEATTNILDFTHCDPPENYFITSEDMVQKSGVWSHFGSWDFNKAQIYNTISKKEYKENEQSSIDYLSDRFNYSENEAKDIINQVNSLTNSKAVNDWIAPWPGYASGINGCQKLSDETFACNIGGGQGLLNTTTMDFSIGTPEGVKHPDFLIYPTEEGLVKKEYNDTIGLGMVVMPSGDGFVNLFMSPQLTGSMFTRLFFMEGHGLKHFEKFSDERSVFGSRIIVWKVDWEGKQENVLPHFNEPEEELITKEVIEDKNEDNKTTDETLEENKSNKQTTNIQNNSDKEVTNESGNTSDNQTIDSKDIKTDNSSTSPNGTG